MRHACGSAVSDLTSRGQPPPPGGQPPPPGGQPPPPGWQPPRVAAGAVTALPVEPRSHPGFLRGPRWRWWKPLAALLVTALLGFLVAGVPAVVGLLLDGVDFTRLDPDALALGPYAFLGNNVGLALLVPLAFLLQWLFFGVRPRWLSSVEGRFRWGWFARCVGIVLPLGVVLIGLEIALGGLPEGIALRPYTVLLAVGIVLTTPLQAAGEEYLMRGLEQRLVASYFRSDVVGWVVATVVSSVSFMLLHGAGDAWLNAFYLSFGVVAAWVTWRTGGLEAAVAIHVVNNLLSEAFLPVTDISGLFDRSAGTGDPTVLLNVAALVGATALIAWAARRRGVVAATAPGRPLVERAQEASDAAWFSAAWRPAPGGQPSAAFGPPGRSGG